MKLEREELPYIPEGRTCNSFVPHSFAYTVALILGNTRREIYDHCFVVYEIFAVVINKTRIKVGI